MSKRSMVWWEYRGRQIDLKDTPIKYHLRDSLISDSLLSGAFYIDASWRDMYSTFYVHWRRWDYNSKSGIDMVVTNPGEQHYKYVVRIDIGGKAWFYDMPIHNTNYIPYYSSTLMQYMKEVYAEIEIQKMLIGE